MVRGANTLVMQRALGHRRGCPAVCASARGHAPADRACPAARPQVSAVQRGFVQKLLTFPVFSKHLAAVREINNMLRRALDLREACPGDERAAAPMKVDQPPRRPTL